ncbi:hypothetical protein Peur_004727 [Populus x canadensis]
MIKALLCLLDVDLILCSLRSFAITVTIPYGRHNGTDNVGTVVASFVPLIPKDTPMGGAGMMLGVHHIICNLELLSLIHQFSFYATFVYGYYIIVAKRLLWDNLSFLELVADKWNLYVQRSPMYILYKKLKHLKELNKLHFSHLSERVSRVEMELEAHQSAFHHD